MCFFYCKCVEIRYRYGCSVFRHIKNTTNTEYLTNEGLRYDSRCFPGNAPPECTWSQSIKDLGEDVFPKFVVNVACSECKHNTDVSCIYQCKCWKCSTMVPKSITLISKSLPSIISIVTQLGYEFPTIKSNYCDPLIFISYAVPDPCASNPCDPNAMCERVGLTAQFTCTCIPPYTGDGFTCTREWSCMTLYTTVQYLYE